MNTLYNAVTAAKEAVVGKDEAAEQAQKSGEEPVAGKTGKGDAVEPYDKGNLPTPLASPGTGPTLAAAAPSSAAHTDPIPVKPDTDASDPSTTAAAAAVPLPESSTAAEPTNADTSGPAVGNAKLVPTGAPTEAKTEAPAATASETITSPAEAEKEIKKDAAEADPELAKKDMGEKAKDKVEGVKEKAAEVTPSTPKKSGTDSVHDASPAGSTKSKKRLSTRLKEKLHIGSAKKDKSSGSGS